VGEHGERRGSLQVGVEIAVDLGDDARDGRDAVLEAGEDRLLAPLPVHDVGPDHALRRLHAAAMGRQEHLVVPRQELLQRGEKLGHAALRWGDDGRVPSHHMVAGEHGALADQGKAEMVRCVAWRVQNIQRDAAGLHHVAVLERPVGPEGGIHEGLAEAWGACAALGPGRSEAQDLAADQRLQVSRPVTMIAMAVGDQDMSDALAAGRFDDGGEMLPVSRPRIDDGHAAAANEVSIGAEEGVGRRIVGNDTAHLRGDLLGHAVVDINASIEGKLCRHGLDLGFWPVRAILAERDSDGSAARNSTLICKPNERKMWPLQAKT